MSPRAKKVVYPLLAVYGVTFFSSIFHSSMIGGSAFPGGRVSDGKYLLEEHGKIIELTATQYWFSYSHGVAVVLLLACVFMATIVFYYTGDIREEGLRDGK